MKISSFDHFTDTKTKFALKRTLCTNNLQKFTKKQNDDGRQW